MAKKPRILETRNIPSDEEIRAIIVDIEKLDEEKVVEHSSYMSKCAKINARKSEYFDSAKSRGIPTSSLKAMLKVRDFERKIKKTEEALEDDQHEIFVTIGKALGDYADLPLGAAAVAREAGQDPVTAAVVDAVRGDMSQAEWDAAQPLGSAR